MSSLKQSFFSFAVSIVKTFLSSPPCVSFELIFEPRKQIRDSKKRASIAQESEGEKPPTKRKLFPTSDRLSFHDFHSVVCTKNSHCFAPTANEAFPPPSSLRGIVPQLPGMGKEGFSMQKTLLGEAEKANKSRRRCIARFAKEKSKERRRQNEVPHDAVRCVLRVLSRCQSWLSVLWFAFTMELELAAKKSPSQKRTRESRVWCSK